MYRYTRAGIATVLLIAAVGSGLPAAWAITPPPVEPGAQPHEQPPSQPPAPSGPSRLAPSAAVTRDGFISVQVNVDASGANLLHDAANEPSIAVDPTNPNRIVIGWRQFDSVDSDFREAGYAYSRDAGRTWTFPGVLQEDVFRSDPVLDADNSGNFYYYGLTLPDEGGHRYPGELFKSIDGGNSWTGPVRAVDGDKQWMTVDRTGGVGDGNIYVLWALKFARSVDGGQSFETPIWNPGMTWGTVSVGADGAVYGAAGHYIKRSSNAQDPNAVPEFEHSLGFDFGGTGPRAWVGPNPGGLLGQACVACDHSTGSSAGNVYVLLSLDPNDAYDPLGLDPLDIHIVRSEDRGETWSPPVRVNDDPSDTRAWQWFGTMDVAPNGRIDAVWNDTRNDADPFDPTFSELYYSYSEDAGETWSANMAVSPAFNHFLGYPDGNDKLGDYYHIRSDNVGVNVAYAATFNGEQDVWFLRIGDYDCNGNGIGDADDLAEATSADLNGNGVPDECDCLGDLDHDWDVDLSDLATLLSNFGETGGSAYEDGDVDEDGDIDTADIQMLLNRFGLGCP